MASDEEISARLITIVENADLETTTITIIRKQLEKELDVDLTSKKKFIRDQIDKFISQKEEKEAEEKEAAIQVKSNDVNGSEQEGGTKAKGKNKVKAEGEEEDTGREADTEVVHESEDAYESKEEEEEADNEVESEEEDAPKKDNSVRRPNKQQYVSRREKAKMDRAIKESMPKEKKKQGGGFQKPYALSPELQVVTGEEQMPRPQVVKAIWNYIHQHSLQKPSDKRVILCDETMQNVFGVKEMGMFRMNKLLTKHLWPIGDGDGSRRKAVEDEDLSDTEASEAASSPKKRKVDKKERAKAQSSKAKV